MRRTVLLTVLLLLAPAFAGAQQKAKLDTGALEARIDKILELDELEKSEVGIYAIDVETNEVLYAKDADDAFNPASNIKLVTAAVALETVGPHFVWGTRISAESVDDDGVVKGPLYLKSEGDPLVLWEDLLSWAAELRAVGVEKVTGGIVVDDTDFADGFIPPGYDQKDEDASYRAPIGAVSLNFNSQTVVVRPADKVGEKAEAYLWPPNSNVELVNDVDTVSGGRERISATSKAKGDGTRIRIRGSIGADAEPAYVRKRIDNPSLFAGSAFVKALELAGITVEGGVRRGERPDGTRTLIYKQSEPLAHVVVLMNKWSNNFLAEMLYRHLGRGKGGANTARARKAVNGFMDGVGAGGKGFKTYNGSGLYDGNTITPRQIVTLLDYMTEQPTYPEFAASMALGGTDGTLSSRLGGPSTKGVLRAKTGTLNDVTALSGYLETKSGRQVAYSILINEPPVRAWKLRRVQDEIVDFRAGDRLTRDEAHHRAVR